MSFHVLTRYRDGGNAAMIHWIRAGLLSMLLAIVGTASAQADELKVSPNSVSVAVGATARVAVSNASGTVSVRSADTRIATASYANGSVTITGVAAGKTTITVSDRRRSRPVEVTVSGSTASLTVSPTSLTLAVNATGQIQVSGARGTVTARSGNPLVATASYANNVVSVRGLTIGSTSITVADSRSSRSVAVSVTGTTGGGGTGTYALLAWNDLGMHCVDGSDYSVFSILPPYNNLHAQLINKSNGSVVTSGVTLSYEAVADTRGSINTISSTKTNFWQYVKSLFGVSPAPDVGLTGNPTASCTPAAMTYNATHGWF